MKDTVVNNSVFKQNKSISIIPAKMLILESSQRASRTFRRTIRQLRICGLIFSWKTRNKKFLLCALRFSYCILKTCGKAVFFRRNIFFVMVIFLFTLYDLEFLVRVWVYTYTVWPRKVYYILRWWFYTNIKLAAYFS